MADKRLIGTLQESYQQELRAAELYRMLGGRQKDEKRRGIFNRLAEMEEKHAAQFAEKLEELGAPVPAYTAAVSAADRLVTNLFGTDAMLRRMEAEEERNVQVYNTAADGADGLPEISRMFTQIEQEEQSHARLLQEMQAPNEPAGRLEAMLKREKWHVSTGSWIGDAIYGVNDGLGAVFGIVSGMAGYTQGGHQVVVAGMFGMLASALSMGSGAFLAAKSEREVHEAEIGRERKEIEENPEHEREELALIYQLKGFSEEDSFRMAATVAERPELFLQTMAHEELGLSDRNFPNPWTALVSSTLATAVGALIPVVPFFFMSGMPAVIVSALVSTVAHFAVGAAKSLVTARGWFSSGLEMTLVGIVEAVIAYGLGVAFGAHGGA